MNTREILNVLRSDAAVNPTLLGVFPIDLVPPVIYKPASLVINLDPSSEPGSHWVCLYIDKKGRCDYFDSYGREPNSLLKKYIFQNSVQSKHNTNCVQRILTSTCGQMCVYFLIWRCRGVPMKLIMNSLEEHTSDEFVTGFVNNLFKINTIVQDQNFIINQYGTILRNLT